MYSDAIGRLSDDIRLLAEEIRLRAGQFLSIAHQGGEEELFTHLRPVTAHDLTLTMENATKGSLHSAIESIQRGFVTIEGGHRLAICGRALLKDGVLSHVRDISSVCIRIAREKKGVARSVLPKLIEGGRIQGTLILSPPGVGKTTLLRDIIRMLSCGEAVAPHRVSVADERGELAGCLGGIPQMDVGPRTDVWSGMPKSEAAVMMLRGCSPQVLALDEITAPQDAAAAQMSFGCGAAVLATAHARCVEDLRRRPLYRSLPGIFTRAAVISLENGKRKYGVSNFEGG
ncbi:MAG: stage III sporulation protein AB [Oscillospiraceae bacterium]|nr:stage III sporulation protein AB [Oscillospiraceae bacterium]